MAEQLKKPEDYPSWWDIRYWPIRLIFALLRFSVVLPLPVLYFLGDCVGFGMRIVLRKRVKIAKRNLELCFPDKSSEDIRKILKSNFSSMGRAIFETGMAWYWSDERIRKHMIVSDETVANIKAWASQGQVVLTCHMLDLEMHARLYGMIHPGVGVYKPNSNPVVEYEQTKGRTRANKYMVSHKNLKGIIKALRDGNPIWYAADQDYRTKSRVFVPFFAVPDCPTVTAPSVLGRLKNVVSIPSYAIRMPGGKYKLVVEPKLENFPTGDEVKDAKIFNEFIERAILEAPDQYMWVHRRFATRPSPDMPTYYSDSIQNMHKKPWQYDNASESEDRCDAENSNSACVRGEKSGDPLVKTGAGKNLNDGDANDTK